MKRMLRCKGSCSVKNKLLIISKSKCQISNKISKHKTLLDEERNAGEYSITTTVDNLSSGIYFTNLSIDGVQREVSKVVVLR